MKLVAATICWYASADSRDFLTSPDGVAMVSSDTFSMPQTQEEFYFALPYQKMDLCLYGRNHEVPAAEVAGAVGLTAEQIERVYRDIDQKRRTTRYLHERPLLVEPVPEVSH